MKQDHLRLTAAAQAADFADMSARATARDSLFMLSDISVAGWPAPVSARVRNLSAGGMLIESAHHFAEGMVLEATLPNLGRVSGRCIWSGDGRFGIAFDHEIDPQAVRRRPANQDLPHVLLGQPRRQPRIRRTLRPI